MSNCSSSSALLFLLTTQNFRIFAGGNLFDLGTNHIVIIDYVLDGGSRGSPISIVEINVELSFFFQKYLLLI